MVKRISRKGFTLVELLAVIVVLGLLVAIISIPVLGTLTKSKNTLNSMQVKMIESAAKNMGLENLAKLPSVSNTASKCITIGELVEEGFLEEVPKNLKTEEEIDINSGVIISCNNFCKKLTYKYVENCDGVQTFFGEM